MLCLTRHVTPPLVEGNSAALFDMHLDRVSASDPYCSWLRVSV